MELFRKQGDKLIKNLDNKYENLVGQLEFAIGKKLIIKDLDFLMNYRADYDDPAATAGDQSKTELNRSSKAGKNANNLKQLSVLASG